jgi:2-polyprenyl-3-methyl-5-hydroxy-6-metoxy-1,4-benzoquinol methylase
MLGLKANHAFVDLLNEKVKHPLALSEYSQAYLQRILPQAFYFTTIYEFLLQKLSARTGKAIAELTVLDFGGGIGLFSAYLKFRGVKTVYYLDHYEAAYNDAQTLLNRLGFPADAYILGSFPDFDLPIDGMLSTDVWEHVYDTQSWQDDVVQRYPNLVQLHATGANPYHFSIASKLKAVHYANEYTDRPVPVGAKSTDSYRAYFSLRLAYIQSRCPDLQSDDLQFLAKQTRGLIYEDIDKALASYFKENSLGYAPSHPSNTCNPQTGNWSERLYDRKEMQSLAQNVGWQIALHTISYNPSPNKLWKKPVVVFMTWWGKLLPRLAPYFLPILVWEFFPKTKK